MNPLDKHLPHTLFERSAAAAFVLDMAGSFQRVTGAMAQLLGCPPAQLLGTHLLDYLSPEAGAPGAQHLAEAAAGAIVRYQASLAPPAEPLALELQLLPQLSATGQVVAIQGLAQPLASTATLMERELTVLFDSIADVTFVLNVEAEGRYRFHFTNKAFEKTTGLPSSAVVGRYVEEIIPEPSLSLVLPKYAQAVRTLQRVVWLETTVYPTGQVTGEVSVMAVCDASGRCNQLVGVVHDLTKEKQVEEALRLSNERFRYAIQATSDAIYDWNVAADTVYWGEGFASLFGHQLLQNPAPFQAWADGVHPTDSERVVGGLRRVAQAGTASAWQEEYRFRRADGSWANVLDRGYLLRDAQGRAVRMLGAMQDITERQQAAERQQLLTQQLAFQNADLQQFTYIISHNLRAPLANARGCANLLPHLDYAAPAFGETLQHLRTSLWQLDEVLTDINQVLSIRDAQDGYRPEPVAVAAVCRQALLGLQAPLRASGGQVVSTIPEALRLPGSRAHFHSIFHNLLSNAIKYRSDERALRVDVAATHDATGHTQLTFRDNGLGFDQLRGPDDIFQLYQRLHPSKAGRGIGLFLVKAHVEAMGGHISVRSRVQEGTEFTITFRSAGNENVFD